MPSRLHYLCKEKKHHAFRNHRSDCQWSGSRSRIHGGEAVIWLLIGFVVPALFVLLLLADGQ